MTETDTIPSWVERIKGHPDPAIHRWPDGSVKEISYANKDNNAVHRDGAPAQIAYHENGTKRCERWIQNGDHHRDDDPAVTCWDDEGNVTTYVWRREGAYHRDGDDIPAAEEYYPTGEIKMQCWYQGSDFHRTSGPAIIAYKKDGSIEWQEFYEHGEEVHRNY